MTDDDDQRLTLVLVPLSEGPGMSKEEIDPDFHIRPPLTLSYPSPSKNPMGASDMLGQGSPDNANANTNGRNFHLERYKTSQGMSSLALGRNLLTRVYDTKLSRRLATMEFKKLRISESESNKAKVKVVLRVNQGTATHKLCLNGTRVILEEVDIVHGDEICLHGDKYRYQVNIIDNTSKPANVSGSSGDGDGDGDDGGNVNTNRRGISLLTGDIPLQVSQETCVESDEASSRKRKRNGSGSDISSSSSSSSSNDESTPITRTNQIQENARRQILDDLTCTICMEILVHTHVANPCGHVFCKSCIDKIPSIKKNRSSSRSSSSSSSSYGFKSKSCPSCRKEISSLSWARSYDNVVWNMILMGDVFGSGPHGEGDLKEFMMRSGRKWKDLSKDQRDCILRRCKRLQHRDHIDDDNDDDTQTLQRFHMICKEVPHYRTYTNHTNDEVTIVDVEPSITSAAGTVEDPICL